MSDMDVLLAGICAAPTDLFRVRLLADWLEERGDDWSAQRSEALRMPGRMIFRPMANTGTTRLTWQRFYGDPAILEMGEAKRSVLDKRVCLYGCVDPGAVLFVSGDRLVCHTCDGILAGVPEPPSRHELGEIGDDVRRLIDEVRQRQQEDRHRRWLTEPVGPLWVPSEIPDSGSFPPMVWTIRTSSSTNGE